MAGRTELLSRHQFPCVVLICSLDIRAVTAWHSDNLQQVSTSISCPRAQTGIRIRGEEKAAGLLPAATKC